MEGVFEVPTVCALTRALQTSFHPQLISLEPRIVRGSMSACARQRETQRMENIIRRLHCRVRCCETLQLTTSSNQILESIFYKQRLYNRFHKQLLYYTSHKLICLCKFHKEDSEYRPHNQLLPRRSPKQILDYRTHKHIPFYGSHERHLYNWFHKQMLSYSHLKQIFYYWYHDHLPGYRT